ncbi:hypothetical protein G3A_04575 [Bacillus sp. 17376]|uniref:Uncharacterized protein n=1 Tax=Mesobacillus boroniphilus JCM 21738 TaxID=1294265 RepID=W4RK37_9BACI|nr:hypothetical protein [Mesobacillus boroniphilus]ESU33751.1 hypothetical protein G3A_04575 [Bacillus sp. 17376]GAE44676.1 hypothetical protein JCM21738_1407 [Mesobacillus boroniphilus JCM 21738]
MNISFNNLLNKAKTTLNQAFGHAKETLYSITGSSSASVQQIADFVRNHPDVKVVKKEYLGVTISFFELVQGKMRYYLETNNSKILQLDVHSHNHTVLAYRSYRDQLSVDTPVKFPDLQNAK